MILNCVTIDDEPLALNLINSFVQRTSFLDLKAAFGKASEAVSGLKQPDIHLVFLDINMPGINGIEIARLLQHSPEHPQPKVIFSTAHNQFAVESYQVEALDYLLKPFEYESFLRAAEKGLQFFDKRSIHRQLMEEALYVKKGYQLTKILLKDIKYIQGLKDYAVIHLKNAAEPPVITLSTLKSLSTKLPSDRFIRVHRSFIVSLKYVAALSANSLWLDDKEIPIGAQYKNTVHSVFSKLL